MCATWVPQIIGAVPGIQHGESRVTTVGPYSPNVAMSIIKQLFVGMGVPLCICYKNALQAYRNANQVLNDFHKYVLKNILHMNKSVNMHFRPNLNASGRFTCARVHKIY